MSHALAYHQVIAECLRPSESISVSEAGRGGEGGLPCRSVSFHQENQGLQNSPWSVWSYPYRPDFGLVDIIWSPRKDFEKEGYRQPYVIVQQTQDASQKETWTSWVCWCTPLIPALRPRQTNVYEFKTILLAGVLAGRATLQLNVKDKIEQSGLLKIKPRMRPSLVSFKMTPSNF